jgi:hypothetical protein
LKKHKSFLLVELVDYLSPPMRGIENKHHTIALMTIPIIDVAFPFIRSQ